MRSSNVSMPRVFSLALVREFTLGRRETSSPSLISGFAAGGLRGEGVLPGPLRLFSAWAGLGLATSRSIGWWTGRAAAEGLDGLCAAADAALSEVVGELPIVSNMERVSAIHRDRWFAFKAAYEAGIANDESISDFRLCRNASSPPMTASSRNPRRFSRRKMLARIWRVSLPAEPTMQRL